MIIVYNGNQKIMEVFNPFVYLVHEFGHQMFIFITGKKSKSPKKETRIYFVQSADDNFEGTMKTNLVVQYNGSILFVPPGILKSICPFNINSFPFVSFYTQFVRCFQYFCLSVFLDVQNCTLKFGSWSFDESGE
jgi:hypothetical protein